MCFAGDRSVHPEPGPREPCFHQAGLSVFILECSPVKLYGRKREDVGIAGRVACIIDIRVEASGD